MSVPIAESDLSSHTAWEIDYSEQDQKNLRKSQENSNESKGLNAGLRETGAKLVKGKKRNSH